MSDGEEETILWAVWEDTVREPFSRHSPLSMQMLLKESERQGDREEERQAGVKEKVCFYFHIFIMYYVYIINTE